MHDRIDDLVQFLVDALQFPLPTFQIGAALDAQPVHLLGELGAELLEQRRLHQVLAQPVEDRGFKSIAPDVEAIVASAFVTRGRAAEKVLRDHRITAPAAAAFDQAREEVLRAPPVIHEIGRRLGFRLIGQPILALLHGRPDILGDNPQFRYFLDYPFALRVKARHAPTGVGILDVPQPVPDQFADIHLVVQDAGAALRVAMDGGRPPFAPLWTGHAFPVQCHGDRTRRLSVEIVVEDTAHDPGFGLVDGPVAPDSLATVIELLHHVIAVAEPAAGLAILDAAAQPASGLVG